MVNSQIFPKEFRFQEIATGCVDRAPRRTHIFLSCRVAHVRAHFDLHTRMRVAQDVHRSCVVPLRTQK